MEFYSIRTPHDIGIHNVPKGPYAGHSWLNSGWGRRRGPAPTFLHPLNGRDVYERNWQNDGTWFYGFSSLDQIINYCMNFWDIAKDMQESKECPFFLFVWEVDEVVDSIDDSHAIAQIGYKEPSSCITF
jgi:hypothetical protein